VCDVSDVDNINKFYMLAAIRMSAGYLAGLVDAQHDPLGCELDQENR
jgi:hypothetical protein